MNWKSSEKFTTMQHRKTEVKSNLEDRQRIEEISEEITARKRHPGLNHTKDVKNFLEVNYKMLLRNTKEHLNKCKDVVYSWKRKLDIINIRTQRIMVITLITITMVLTLLLFS